MDNVANEFLKKILLQVYSSEDEATGYISSYEDICELSGNTLETLEVAKDVYGDYVIVRA